MLHTSITLFLFFKKTLGAHAHLLIQFICSLNFAHLLWNLFHVYVMGG